MVMTKNINIMYKNVHSIILLQLNNCFKNYDYFFLNLAIEFKLIFSHFFFLKINKIAQYILSFFFLTKIITNNAELKM